MHKYVLIIPARYASSRLPGKPLLNISGKSLIQRTIEQCKKVVPEELIYVATESDIIKDHCENLGINVLMTSDKCLTGTDRIAECVNQISAENYINVQGDEPLINPEDIKNVINYISDKKNESYNVLAGYCSIKSEEEFNSFNIPKIVFDTNNNLLYTSRSPIPGSKNGNFRQAWRQVCIYSFKRTALQHIQENPKKMVLEEFEDLELLRFIEAGIKVKMIELSDESIAVDVLEDIEKVIDYLKNNS